MSSGRHSVNLQIVAAVKWELALEPHSPPPSFSPMQNMAGKSMKPWSQRHLKRILGETSRLHSSSDQFQTLQM